MRRNCLGNGAIWILAAGSLQFEPWSRANEPKDDRMTAIVAAVRAEEAKYRDIEYATKITTRTLDPKAPDVPGEVTSLTRRRVVLQGDLFHFREDVFEKTFATKMRAKVISAYDGETTRTVVAGNCINIHQGRFEHPDIYPAHCLPLAHYRVNFPLSVYLSGTEAIHADPKYPRLDHETGSVVEFTRVAARFEGEEEIDGLRCLKIRVDRWHYSKDVPALQYLWLAPARNYLCVKEQLSWPKSRSGDRVLHEMRMSVSREVVPGVWFPTRITVEDYDRQAPKSDKPAVVAVTETVVEEVTLSPKHEVAFFRDIPFPADLPVFTIKDRALVGSSLPEPAGGDDEKAKLAEVVARVREQEARYAACEVKVRMAYKSLKSQIRMGGIINEQEHELHSILLGDRANFTLRRERTTLGGARSEGTKIQASDGQWLRTLDQSSDGEKTHLHASLQKMTKRKAEGRLDGIPVLRPHTLMQHDGWIYGPLADLLVSPWLDKTNKYRLRFRYCGELIVEGHPCIRLRGDVMVQADDRPHSSFVLFLATDRNLIPIRIEHYGGNFGYQAMPTGVRHCDDFREVAAGIWYPSRVTELAFDGWVPMAQGWIVPSWRRDYTIESVNLSPKVDEALFQGPSVPEGTKVQILDEERRFLGEIKQGEAGVALIAPERFSELQAGARRKEKENELPAKKKAR